MASEKEREREENLRFLRDYSNYLLQGREQVEAGYDKMVSSLSGGALGILLVFFLNADHASFREEFGREYIWLIFSGVAFVISIVCGLSSLWASGREYGKRSQDALSELMNAVKSGKVPSLESVYEKRTGRWIRILHYSSAIFLAMGLVLLSIGIACTLL